MTRQKRLYGRLGSKYTAVLKFSFKLKGQIILGAGDVKVSVIKKIKFNLVVLFFFFRTKIKYC